MLRYSFVVLAGLVACAELKSAPPRADEDVPPATTSKSPTLPQATQASHTTTSTDAEPTPRPGHGSNSNTEDDAGPGQVDSGAIDLVDPEAAGNVICEALCDFRHRCSPGGPAWCKGNCLGNYGPISAHLRATYVQYAKDCLATAACSADEEACLDARTIERAPASVPVVQTCLLTRSSCQGDIQTDCYELLEYNDATRAKFMTCFDGDCKDVQDCIDHAATE